MLKIKIVKRELKFNKSAGAGSEKGAVSFEAAIGSLLFFLILILGIEFMRVSLSYLALQYVTYDVTRYSTLGKGVKDGTRQDKINMRLKEIAKKLHIDPANTYATFCIDSNCHQGGMGDAGERIFVRLHMDVPILYGSGKIRLESRFSARNEKFKT